MVNRITFTSWFIIAILLTACGTSTGTPYPIIEQPVVRTVEVHVAGTPIMLIGYATSVPGMTAPLPMQENRAAYSNIPYPASNIGTFNLGSQSGNQMVLKNAQLELLVEDIDLTIEQITQQVKDQGGYITSAQVWNKEGSRRAEMRMNVPSENFEQTLSYLRNLGIKVLTENTSGVDISAEYTDLQSRLANLEATAARVRGFLDDARTVEDALRINAELSNLEGQIEQTKGMLHYYEGRTEFSSIYVLLNVDLPYPTPTPTPGWSPGTTLRQASDTMVFFWQSFVDILIWIVLLGWPFAILVIIIWLVMRRRKRRVQKMIPPEIG